MKKFLIFLISIVVVVCIGLTTFYFLRNDEVISINKKEIYCNAGDTISLESLGIKIIKDRKKTTFNYNAGGEEVTQFVNYNEEAGGYEVSAEKGGDVTVVITTTNENYARFEVLVHIGNGSVETPYYIFNETDLSKIGGVYRIDSHYTLMNNVILSSDFQGVGSEERGFAGTFNGNGYTISGLTLKNEDSSKVIKNAGLFASITAEATVSNLRLDNVSINGYYKNVGALAGTISGTVERVAVTNATITNLAGESSTGVMAGTLSNTASPVQKVYVDTASVIVGNEAVSKIENSSVGGFVGTIDKSTVKACYTNNTKVTTINASVMAGGFAGKFVIAPNAGIIHQSYANTTSTANDYAYYIHTIEKEGEFTEENSTMLKHLVGNFAIVSENRASASEIVDTDLVKVYDDTYFVRNEEYQENTVFYNQEGSQYFVRGFVSEQEAIDTNEYIFYALDRQNKTAWEEDVWVVSTTNLPTLRMGLENPSNPVADYFLKSITKVEGSTEPESEINFFNFFSGKTVIGDEYHVSGDMDFSSENWIPGTLTNSKIYGHGYTIKVKLSAGEEPVENFGLFTIIEGSTINDLKIEIVSMDAKSSANAGGIGAVVTGTDVADSALTNVTVKYTQPVTSSYNTFGGLVGTAEGAQIINCKVEGLTFAEDTVVNYAGGIVAENKAGSEVKQCAVTNSNIKANNVVGGIVATNDATISNASGDYTVTHFANGPYAVVANVGGVAGVNNSVIKDSNVTVKIAIEKADAEINVGGVVAINNSTISNVTLKGDGISVADTVNQQVFVGGVAAYNNENASITSTRNYLTEVGTYVAGKNFKVGGLTYKNNGKIYQSVVSSTVSGNEVAGITTTMNSGSIDEVLVGVETITDGQLTFEQNNIKGDKYVAGIAVSLYGGNVTNIQSVSKIIGAANKTNSSLMVLVFPRGPVVDSVTVNSSITGNGHMYRETWADFISGEEGANSATGDERSYFGIESGNANSSFNLYTSTAYHGTMKNVVINISNEGVSSAKGARGTASGFKWGGFQVKINSSYKDEDGDSYIKYVQGIYHVDQFKDSFEFEVCDFGWGGVQKATRTLSFHIATSDTTAPWTSNNGITLTFLLK